jgi:hypothetical protein
VRFGESNHFAEKSHPDLPFKGDYHFHLSALSQDLLLLVSESRLKLAQQSSALQ